MCFVDNDMIDIVSMLVTSTISIRSLRSTLEGFLSGSKVREMMIHLANAMHATTLFFIK